MECLLRHWAAILLPLGGMGMVTAGLLGRISMLTQQRSTLQQFFPQAANLLQTKILNTQVFTHSHPQTLFQVNSVQEATRISLRSLISLFPEQKLTT
jgi:hypothetical protein